MRPDPRNPKAIAKPTQPKEGSLSREIAGLLLTRVIDDGRNLDALCDHVHGLAAFKKLAANDQALARALVLAALRHRNAIMHILKQIADRNLPRNARLLHHTLHIALAQVFFLDVPESAAVNIAVEIIARDKRTQRFKGLVNALLRRSVREKETLLASIAEISPFPKWFEKEIRRDYGRENLKRIEASVLTRARIDVSVKSQPSAWAEKLSGVELPTGSIRLPHATAIEALPGYKAGEWWVQDAAASLPAKLLFDLPVGTRVLELCAAPGGKTAQLAAHGFQVTAIDNSASRLSRLNENLSRLSLHAETIEADILTWEPTERFDAILLDAPCSSTGTIRRHPDILWNRTMDDIKALVALQHQLIDKALSFLNPGGKLVFSNCSMLKIEGETLLANLLKEREDIRLEAVTAENLPDLKELINGQGAIRSLPFHLKVSDEAGLNGMDGFFACQLRKL